MITMIQSLDNTILIALFNIRTIPWSHAFIWVTEMGSMTTILGFFAIVVLLLSLKKCWHTIVGLTFAVFGSGIVAYILKVVVHRARPDVAYRAYVESGYSFPSGHATLSAAFYFFIAYLIAKEVPPGKWRYDVWLAAFIFVGLIGFSRLYLGVHFASDVIAGYAIGGLFAWIGVKIAER